MREHVTCSIPLNGVSPTDFKALAELISSNGHIFESYIMGKYDGDARYSYHSDLFEVVEIEEGSFAYCAQISYFEGCKDKDYVDFQDDTISYEIIDETIVFELFEIDWDVR